MKQQRHHSWNLSTDEAVQVQRELALLVEHSDRLSASIRYVAGVDVAYGLGEDRNVYGVLVVIDLETNETVETATAVREMASEYQPGLFAFRELPSLCEAAENLQCTPDLVICDGQGVAHPERCGLASHFGLLFDVPTIGCGKTRLLGEFDPVGTARGSYSELIDGGDVIGSVLRTQDGINPLFVSTGHRVSLPTARDWMLRLADTYRQPEPIRRANQLANELRAGGAS
ncbi:MAG: endonuclease V [Planctomycetaceae bacterium]